MLLADPGVFAAFQCAGKRFGKGAPRLLATLGWVLAVWLGLGSAMFAGSPRFVGAPNAGNPGVPLVWQTTQLSYFTDIGDLSTSVSHAQADKMVAAAAAVWNVPTSSLTLAQGGTLSEHVSSANMTIGNGGVLFPADVQPSNEAQIPVAIVYDTDGSVTDLLLGKGASTPGPLGCSQTNSVVGDVDDFGQHDALHHATLVLNGRCVTSAAEPLMQMQYRLARAFGRILGLSWSQTNDNIFTVKSPPTAQQMAFWPLMHPVDVLCGYYTYQCMTDPFTLRVDDLSSLARLYPVPTGNVPSGKRASSDDAAWVLMTHAFPTGQGMEWANVTVHRVHYGITETWETVSGVTGGLYQQAWLNPVTRTQAVNIGSTDSYVEGRVEMRRVPLDGISDLVFTSEPINPLYNAEYAVGSYVHYPVAPSGSSQTWVDGSATPNGDSATFLNPITPSDATASCAPGTDGTEASPAALDPTGWQNGVLCGYEHSSWWGMTIAANHSWTFEVQATDEKGHDTSVKAWPIIGVWQSTDPLGGVPTVAKSDAPLNSIVLGMTQVHGYAKTADRTLRMAVADQYGADRPDFTYTARLLYAASVSPNVIGMGGGTITITGTGFRQGNQVNVNGVGAQIVSCTANQIVATAPSYTAANAHLGRAVTVTVVDPSTLGSTAINSALMYTNSADLLQKISAPTAMLTGSTAASPFAVRVLASDGVTPVAGATVQFSVVSGSATLGLCGTGVASCWGTTDSSGQVSTSVISLAAGTITLSAKEVSGGASLQVVIADADPVRSVGLSDTARWSAAGAPGTWSLQLKAVENGLAAVSVPVFWTTSPGLVIGPVTQATDGGGGAMVSVRANLLASGSTSTVTGCVWTTVCATWTVYGVDPAQWQVLATAGAGQSVLQGTRLDAVSFQVTDGQGHSVQNAPVTLYQRALAWEGSCTSGDCPASPVLASTQTVAVSDAAGAIALTPLQVPGLPQTVQIAATGGTLAFLTLTLVVSP